MDLKKVRELLKKDPQEILNQKIEEILKETKAFWKFKGREKEPHALLSSGLHSDGYLNLNEVFKFPNYLDALAEKLIEKIKFALRTKKIEVDVIVSSSYAALPLGEKVASKLNALFVFTEKKENYQIWSGRFTLPEKAKVLQVEDVISSLKTVKEVRKALLKANPKIEFLKTFDKKNVVATLVFRPTKEGNYSDFKIIYLLKWKISAWRKERCFLCRLGSKALKPKENWKKFLRYCD